MNESNVAMYIHSLVISIVAYFIMVYALKQNNKIAENRSMILGSAVFIYMILFGHDFPPRTLNPNV